MVAHSTPKGFMELDLSSSDINTFLTCAKLVDKVGAIYFQPLPENVANLFVLSGKYSVSSNAGYYDIEKIKE